MSGVAIAAAAAAAKKKREEEEDMTPYGKEDLEGWEFKIVRSTTGRFKDYKRVQELCQEEAQAGWEMVEKFDNYRIRFKRRIERRSSDSHLGTDPYRTQVGIGEGSLAAVIISVIFGLIAAGFLITLLARRHDLGSQGAAILPFVGILVIAAALVVIIRVKRH